MYLLCNKSLFEQILWHLAVRYQGGVTSHNSNTLSRREFTSCRLASRSLATHGCIALLYLRQFSTLTTKMRVPSLPGSPCTSRLLHFTVSYETLPTIAIKTRQVKAVEHNTRCMLNLNKLLRVTFPLVPHPNTTLFTMLLYALYSRGTNGNHLGMERRRTKEQRGTKI